MNLYFTRLLNSAIFFCLAGLVIAQRDIDGGLLIKGWHGLGLVVLVAFTAAVLNFRGALSALFLIDD